MTPIDASKVSAVWTTHDDKGTVVVYDHHVEILAPEFARLTRQNLLALAAALEADPPRNGPKGRRRMGPQRL